MIFRTVLAIVLMAPLLMPEPAEAVSPFEFLRRQHQKEERRQRRPPPPPPPSAPAPAEPSAGEAAAPDTPAPVTPPPGVTVAPARNTPPPPYEKDMRRIGEILGALHYLRPLCGADDGSVWRDKMNALIEAEGGPADRRERFAGAFNHGYSAYQLTYRTCTPSADLAVRRYLEEGAKLTREIATRHGN